MVEAAIERIVETYQFMSRGNAELNEQMRVRLENYIRTLFEGGQSDPNQLTIFGLTYLREKVGKNDPVRDGYTGL
jgi:hypothetical protein